MADRFCCGWMPEPDVGEDAMKVLLVEDDAALAAGLAEVLRQAGLVVDTVADGDAACLEGCDEIYDAAVLDLGLPRQDGLSVLRHWREQGRDFPVLVLTARGRWSDKRQAFEEGADDYLTKPFLPDEVLTRLRVLHKRATRSGAGTEIRVGALHYHALQGRLQLADQPLTLTAQEQRILTYLVQQAGRCIQRGDLIEHVYGRDLDPDSNTLEVLIGRIRKKLAPHELIHTVRGLGYVLEDRSA